MHSFTQTLSIALPPLIFRCHAEGRVEVTETFVFIKITGHGVNVGVYGVGAVARTLQTGEDGQPNALMH
jgi:hypothetical protein